MIVPQQHYALDDRFLVKRIAEVVTERVIDLVVETGVNEGKSTTVLCGLARRVVGIDNSSPCIESARARVMASWATNWRLVLGNSPDVIRSLSLAARDPDKILWFLDAHWDDYWPIRDEISALLRGKGVILVHDLKVPGTSWGFDRYEDHDLDYEYLQDVLTGWSPTHRVEYASAVSGSGVGWGFFFPR